MATKKEKQKLKRMIDDCYDPKKYPENLGNSHNQEYKTYQDGLIDALNSLN